ncbi:siderophore-interacting protein [Thermogemmatispora sp.]|uniref:siderophore-interacting protein n=1 Tax=Thermogemmatispora sp. TaxID=1968838 RepID=UPI0035E446E2
MHRAETSEVNQFRVHEPQELAARLGARHLTLQVAETYLLRPHLRHIRLQGEELADFTWLPGQDVMIWLAAPDGRRLYRRYTIRHCDNAARTLDLAVFLHGKAGPGERWAQSLQPGEVVDLVGPRGKITLAEAPWHLFVGDEAFLPATLAMLAALPAGRPAWALLEIASPEEAVPPVTRADLHLSWIYRGSKDAGDPEPLVAASRALALPGSSGQVYVGAELQVARALSAVLEERGFAREQLSVKAYWVRGRANAAIGEPK